MLKDVRDSGTIILGTEGPERALERGRVGSAWTGRVGVCVCLPYIWVQAGRVLPAVNHHF